ncbi:MAG: ABC transporter permease [Candidatus Abyssubacteria bacterium]
MNLTVILKVALRALLRNKVRTLLTTLGIIVGIAAVIAMVAIGQGATIMVEDQIKGMGNNLIIIFPGSSRMGAFRHGMGSERTLTSDDSDALLRDSDYVRQATPLVRTGAQVVYRERNWATLIQGVGTGYPEVRNWEIARGSFFTESDVRGAARVCVLGTTVVEELFGAEDPINHMIRIQNMVFRVIGVLSSKGSAAWGQDQDDTVITPWTTVRRYLQNSPFNDVNQILVSIVSLDMLEAARADIRAILRQRHRLAEGTDDDFSVMDMTEVTQTITQVSRVMTVLLTVIASISLVVGGIGIMNIMLVSVTERTREIGLRMAVGARRNDILMQFLVESTVLAVIGGILGIALGSFAAQMLSRTNGWPIIISPGSIVLAIVFSTAVGVFFGFYPAWRAARLDPIEALRYE